MSLLVLQHADCEPPAAFSRVFEERGLDVRTARLDRGEAIPDWTSVDGIVAMGGPMSVTEAGRVPWIADEISFVAEAVHAGVPFLGVCLGAQLLAASLGARVFVGAQPEVGIADVTLTVEGLSDPVVSVLPRTVNALHWHSDTFEIPLGGVHLAESAAYRNQAFRWRSAYGLQFHLEVTPDLCRQWSAIPEYAESASAALGNGAVARLDKAMEEFSDELNGHARALISRWLDVGFSRT